MYVSHSELDVVRRVPVLAVAVALLGIAGCSHEQATLGAAASGPPSASTTNQPIVPVPPQPSATPGGPSPFIPPTGPPGTLLASATGVGSRVISLRSLPRVGSRLTVRMTCIGSGKVWVRDHLGGEIFGTGGCAAGVVYGSTWTSTNHDGRTISVSFNPGTRWAVDVWLGNPAVSLATPANV
jgi:hypothetical protein